jgi:hypothetical protein
MDTGGLKSAGAALVTKYCVAYKRIVAVVRNKEVDVRNWKCNGGTPGHHEV